MYFEPVYLFRNKLLHLNGLKENRFFNSPSHIPKHTRARTDICVIFSFKKVTKTEFFQWVQRAYRSVNNPQQKIKTEEQKIEAKRKENVR